MRDVAELAGVSRQLVSLVVRGEAGPSEVTRRRVLEIIEEVGYQASTSARLLRGSRTALLGVVFWLGNPLQSRFVERLLDVAPGHGLSVVLSPVTGSRTTDIAITELLGHRVEALACFNPASDSPSLRRALDVMPVVWLGEQPVDPRFDAVRPDEEQGLWLAVQHLQQLGHREIVFVGGRGGSAGPDRARAYSAAMRRVGLGEHVDVVTATFDDESAARAAEHLLARDELPTAIIACSDQSAAAIATVLLRAGIVVPDDVSLIGYDDNPLAALSFHSFTSVRQDVTAAVEATLSLISARSQEPTLSPREVLTGASLTVRASTARPRRQASTTRINPSAGDAPDLSTGDRR